MNDDYAEVLMDVEVPGEGEELPEEPRLRDEEEIQAEVARLFLDAALYTDSILTPSRAQATNYYKARKLGDEEEGRAQYVSPEVRNAVGGIIPSIMRLLFGPDRTVEFAPIGDGDEDGARLRTNYINYVIEKDNPGVLVIYSAIKDALVRRIGVVKWWWDDAARKTEMTLTGLVEDQVILLEADESVDMEIINQYEWTDPRAIAAYSKVRTQYFAALEQGIPIEQLGPEPEAPQPIALFDVEVTHYDTQGRARIEAVPPEEIVFSSDARSKSQARAIFHRRDLPKGDLLAMGIDPDLIEEVAASVSTSLDTNEEAISRRVAEYFMRSERAEGDEDIPFVEGYCYLNVGESDTPTHYKVRMIGTGLKLVDYEKFPERPFAFFLFDPEPHTLDGLSAADYTMDLQLVKSKLIRGTLDSLSFSLYPRTGVVEGQVNIKDVLNTEIGGVIRMRAPGMVQEFTHQFAGSAVFPFLQYLDEEKENRLGISKAAAGLDPDSLQSTTKAAVAATIAGAQQHLDLYARLLIETGMKDLMSGLLRLIIEHQDYARTVRLNDKFVTVDPRLWYAEADVEVNVALGFTMTEERLAALERIAARQEAILTQMGPGNPLVTVGQYAQTLRRITELSGQRDVARFWQDVPLDFNPEPPPPTPSPEDKLADAQVAKVQSDAQLRQAELQIKAQEIAAREQRERDRIEAELFLRAKEIELKYELQNTKITTELEAKLASLKTRERPDDRE